MSKPMLKHLREIIKSIREHGVYYYQRALLERLQSPKREIYDKHSVLYRDSDNTQEILTQGLVAQLDRAIAF